MFIDDSLPRTHRETLAVIESSFELLAPAPKRWHLRLNEVLPKLLIWPK